LPGVILGTVLAHGAQADFIISYLKASIEYARVERASLASTLRVFTFSSLSFEVYVVATTLLSIPVVWLVLRRAVSGDLRARASVVASAVWLAACAYAVLAPGRAFLHYLVLVVIGLAIGLLLLTAIDGASIDVAWFSPRFRCSTRARIAALLVWVSLWGCLVPKHFHLAGAHYEVGNRWVYLVVPSISEAARSGEEISVWGWMPSLYVLSGCPPATRDAIGHFVICPGRYQRYYQNRHLSDLKASRPAVFVDAAVPGAPSWDLWPKDSRHESFPELSEFIAENYVLWHSIRSEKKGVPFRIYVSRERFAQLGSHPPAGTWTDDVVKTDGKP
jgi:hypothetical protein